MSSKENTPAPSTVVKPEPVEVKMEPLPAPELATFVKNEEKPAPVIGANLPPSENNKPVISADVEMPDAPPPPPPMTAQIMPTYIVQQSSEDIDYTPEDALKQGLAMVYDIKNGIKNLQLGSKLRSEVWLREIDDLQSQAAPTTLIAVCGATGSGKSSVLNSVLADQIVPTSGMRACTAVVTQIAYHEKPTIAADVSFLSELEWKQELALLIHDLSDEEGNLKRCNDLKTDAGVAWSKVHALYPTISQETLIRLTPDEIVARDPVIAKILGTTKHVEAPDSKSFSKEIGKYIDSKDQKRGSKRKDRNEQTPEQRKKEAERPALWPLIRQVNVRCRSPALSSGAVLVDLPGSGDSNAARNSIAKDYMKKADCLWILAPITRAVDDKTARDLLGDAFKLQLMNGNYDDHAITFIASKTDDISCTEVIQALQLDDDPELGTIEDRLEECRADTKVWKTNKNQAEKSLKDMEAELKYTRAVIREHEDHRKALQNGEDFTPVLTGKASKKGGKKRKNSRGGKKGSSKRIRKSIERSDSDGDSGSDFGSDFDYDQSDAESNSDESSESNSDDESGHSGSDEDDDGHGDGEDEEATEEILAAKITAGKLAVKEGRAKLTELRKARVQATEHLAKIKKKSDLAQRQKNAFCSLKRSEFSRDVLKEDFRTGLKDLDDAAAEERDPNGFNPTTNVRDYAKIDLPVFTVSSRDFIRLTGQIRGDGEPSCFSNVNETGIPSLQRWCHQLTISSRERAARNFMVHLKTFASSVSNYVHGVENITEADRADLRDQWESGPNGDESDDDSDNGADYPDWHSSDPADPILAGFAGGMYYMNLEKHPKPPRVDVLGNLVGIVPRLTQDFRRIIDTNVEDLKAKFRDGLEDKCVEGANKASDVAVAHSDEFAASMHWGTYRATLRRLGAWRRDLNAELIVPFTKNIAHSWSAVFDSDLLEPFQTSATNMIASLLKEIEASAAPGLKDRVRLQAEASLADARVALQKTTEIVKQTMQDEQKEISRCLSPHVQAQLAFAYNEAMEERGIGSVARQKALFHKLLSESRGEIFEGGADVLLERLEKSAEAVGAALDTALANLAQKIEVSISTLWDNLPADPTQMRARKAIVTTVTKIIEHIEMWQEAAKAMSIQATAHEATTTTADD